MSPKAKGVPASAMTDGELLGKTDSDPELFGQFYDRHATGILKFFLARTACAHTAADLTAETFATALLNRHKYDARKGAARNWLYGIARNQLMNSLRHTKVNERAIRKLDIRVPPVNEESLERIESLLDGQAQIAAIIEALRSVSKTNADAVILRVGHDLGFAEIAKRLQCSEGAARVRVARGLAHLHEALALQA